MIFIKPLSPTFAMKFLPLAFFLREAICHGIKCERIKTDADVTGIDFDIFGAIRFFL